MPDPIRGLRASLSMLVENIRMSVTNITQNRMRSALTVLGIMIGVTAVIALITTVTAVSNTITSTLANMGAGTMTLSITGSDLKSGLSEEDLQTLTDLDCLDGVTPTVSLRTMVSRGGEYDDSVSVAGRNPYWFSVNEDIVTRGRPLNPLDMNGRHLSCLIDQEIVDTFYYGVDPLGTTLYISGLPFHVAGIYDADTDTSITSMILGAPDILIPYTTAMKLNGTADVTNLTLYLADGYDSATASKLLEATLDAMFSYEEDCYDITTMDSLESTLNQMTSMMAALLGGIASIALLVGGIGIMNIMLVSVTERTKEIGLRMAVGATGPVISLQFLIESVLISVTGGLIGVMVGVGASAFVSSFGMPSSVPAWSIYVSFLVCVFIGVLFGYIPAQKAANMDPIEAIRHE